MALETATYIDSLVTTNPASNDSRTSADDHLRLIKAALRRTFPNVAGAVAASHTALSRVADLSASAQLQIDALKDGKVGISATALYAEVATTSLYAESASYAANAGSAVYATSSAFAASASYAYSAGTAALATLATRAQNADSSGYAFSANHAASAVYAITAGEANDYNGSVSAGQIPSASAGGAGVIELATVAENNAGSDLTRAITPGVFAGTKGLTSAGYYVFPGGFCIQWGAESISANTSRTISFPRAFDNACLAVSVTLDRSAGDVAGSANGYNEGGRPLSATQMNLSNGWPSMRKLYWQAFGR